MKFTKMLLVSSTCLLAGSLLAGCHSQNQSQTSSHSTVKFMAKDVIATMDPSLNTDVIGSQNQGNTMEGLYRYHGKQLEPAMATKIVTPTNNGLTYTFPLRKNAKWSNGQPVTAQDFVYAWQRTVNPKTKSQYAYAFENIVNAKDISAGKKAVTTMGVKALNRHTLQVQLNQPVPYFSQLMTTHAFLPQNQKNNAKWGKKYGTSSKTLVFNGPYKLINWSSPDTTWTEVKNNQYWNASAVKVKKLQYQVVKDPSTALNLYQSKKLDDVVLGGDTAKQMRKDKAYNIVKLNATFYIQTNQRKDPLFKNAKIRQALSLSLDRPQLTKQILGDGSFPVSSVTPKQMAYNPNNKQQDFVQATNKSGQKYTTYNPTLAKKLWRQGLAESGQTNKKFTWTLLGDDTDGSKKQGEFLQNQLEKLPGVKINLNNVPFKSRLSKTDAGDFDLVVTGWSADYPDPINFLTLFTSDASNNDGHWNNSSYDNLVNKSLTTDSNNATKRWQDMVQAQDILNEQQAVLPLYQKGEAHLTSSRLKDVQYDPAGKCDVLTLKIK